MIYQYWNGLFDDSLRITTSAGAWCWSYIRVMWQGVGDNMKHTLMDPVTWLWNCSWRSRLCSWALMISMIFLEINIAVMCSVLVEPTVAVDESLHLDTPKLLTNTNPPPEYNEFGTLWFVLVQKLISAICFMSNIWVAYRLPMKTKVCVRYFVHFDIEFQSQYTFLQTCLFTCFLQHKLDTRSRFQHNFQSSWKRKHNKYSIKV